MRLFLIASIIDLWNSTATTRAARARSPCPVPFARATVAVVSCFFYCRFIISCRWSRDRKLSLGAHTSCLPSLSGKGAKIFFYSFTPAHVVLLPCVDVLGSAPARRSHGSPSADFLTKKTNKSTLLKKIDVCRSRWMINTITSARRYLLDSIIIVLCKGRVVVWTRWSWDEFSCFGTHLTKLWTARIITAGFLDMPLLISKLQRSWQLNLTVFCIGFLVCGTFLNKWSL